MVSDQTKTRAASKKKSATEDSSNDKNPTLSAADITALLAAITSAITTSVASVTTYTRTEFNRSISTEINSFDMQSKNFDARAGKGQWYKCMENPDEC